ncbi:unnamed protein product [Moneuplotes crassus]|uniref:Uncharacterized protein n=1 Tax=Euplotes crassus TaxID=5936 RepID=A0AAD1XU15_EUPCR|nr:unnamed protein product [Moneuplotes crassus]
MNYAQSMQDETQSLCKARMYESDAHLFEHCEYKDSLGSTLTREEYDTIIQDWTAFGIIKPEYLKSVMEQRVKQMINDQENPRHAKKLQLIPISKPIFASKPTIEKRVRTDSREPFLGDLSHDTTESGQQEDSEADSFASVVKKSTSRKRVRADAEIKRALRLVKKHLKKLFKSKNSKIIQKRYVNCTPYQIYERMRLTLQSIISEELLADDLVYYAIGILSLKKPSELDCKQKVKKEISDFDETITKFTYKKLENTMQSNSLRVLLRYMTSQTDEATVETLEHMLDSK